MTKKESDKNYETLDSGERGGGGVGEEGFGWNWKIAKSSFSDKFPEATAEANLTTNFAPLRCK
jgi:hypothetical protein